MAQLKSLSPSVGSSPRTLKSRFSASLVRRAATAPSASITQHTPTYQPRHPHQKPSITATTDTHTDSKTALKTTNGLRLIKKLPEAKIYGEELLGIVFQTNDVELVLNPHKALTQRASTLGSSSSSVDASVAEEGCVFGKTARLTSCLKKRAAPIRKSVAFLGCSGKGSEVSSIFLYEPTKVKLPWTGPSMKGAKERAGIYLSQRTQELAKKQVAIRIC